MFVNGKFERNKDLDGVKTPIMRKLHRNKLASLDGVNEIDRIKKRAGIYVSNPAALTALPSPRKRANDTSPRVVT